MWKRTLAELEEESRAKAQPTYIQGGRSQGAFNSAVENMGIKAADLEMIIEGRLAEVQLLRKKIIIFIDSVEDSLLRQIIFYRCVSCMSWPQVAKEIGGGNTADGVRMRFDRAFPPEKKQPK
ncbi:MAG: hypothetical protein IJB73_04240 [Firmicutes bacterium]|nr:hypothetical protein [Bacillota bacterium]MBQ6899866.1 hypothetical protein [Bacillota bacterium]